MAVSNEPSGYADFTQRVLAIVQRLYPDLKPRTDETGTVAVGEVKFGLQNLESRFQLSEGTEEALEALVKSHFDLLLTSNTGDLTGSISWGEAKPLIMPQIMPESFREQVPLISRPFARELLTGVVVDGEKGYRYVREDECTMWGLTFNDLMRVACENLGAKSDNLPLQGSLETGGRLLAVASNDGYDAARILVPAFRQFVATHLGEPFRFGIPNRDFLVCWAVDNAEDFHERFRDQIAGDFQRQPYPLSGEIFETDATGDVRVVE